MIPIARNRFALRRALAAAATGLVLGAGIATPVLAGIVTTYSGGTVGDGGSAATGGSIVFPRMVITDGAGNIYVADTWQHRVRRVDASTNVITTIAGTGANGYSGDGGLATAAQLSFPSGLARDASGNLYISETGNHVIRKVATGTGVITTIAGTGAAGYSGDNGQASSAQFNTPNALAFDNSGNLLVADRGNNRVRRIDMTTGVVTLVAGNGTGTFAGDTGQATDASLNSPRGLSVATNGDIYVADTLNHRIRRIDGTTGVISTFAGSGTEGFSGDGGAATAAALSSPLNVLVDSGGAAYISDALNYRVRKVVGGTITTIAGNGNEGYEGDGSPATSYSVFTPNGLAFDPSGNLVIVDAYNHRVRRLALGSSTISTVVADVQPGDGSAATAARHKGPGDVAVGPVGALYIADEANQAVRVVTAGGTIFRVAGNLSYGFSGDGGQATSARIRYAEGVGVDGVGNVYIADLWNHRIRKVAVATGVISTIAGTGTCGSLGDGGPAASAQICAPWGVEVTQSGDAIFIADTGNHRVRRIDTASGNIVTVAGTGTPGYSGEGLATAAQLSSPRRVRLAPSGDLYIADTGNYRIRKLTMAGTISTVAGTGTYGNSGDGGPATAAMLANPSGLGFDAAGNLYIPDGDFNVIRKVAAATGIIKTIAGNGNYSYGGDGGPALGASFQEPLSVAIDGRRNVYVADYGNSRVRKITQPDPGGDANADGMSDLFWREAAPGVGLSWWTMNGASASGANYFQVDPSWQIAASGDVDGDGRADLVWRRASDGATYLWTLNGLGFKGFFDLGILDPAQWSLAGVADLNGNGKADVVWRGTDGTVYAWLMNGGSISSQGVIGNPGTQWAIAALADMDGDGKADIVFRNVNDGGIYIYFMNGLSMASGGFVGIVDPAAWTLAGAADFDGDGKADFLWRHTTGDTWVWKMNGASFVTAGGIGNPGPGWTVESLGDFDGDGQADLVWRYASGTTYLWKMNGTSVSSYLPVSNPGGSWQIVAP